MEILVGGLIVVHAVSGYLAYRERKSLLHAAMSKTTHEFIQLERTPRKKVRKAEPLQDDAGIPHGL